MPQSISCLLLLFIFALNLDFTISISTVFKKFPTAIKTRRTPQKITCQKRILSPNWMLQICTDVDCWILKWGKESYKSIPATRRWPPCMQSWAAVVQHMPQNPISSPEAHTIIQVKTQFQKHYNIIRLNSGHHAYFNNSNVKISSSRSH